MTIVARDLLVEYPGAGGVVRALEHPGFTVELGRSVAIMGPSGCGKSTLLGLVAGLAVPTHGSIAVEDTIVSALPERARVRFRRDHVGMVYQSDNLLPHLTVEENVALPLAIRGGPGPGEHIGTLLARLGIEELATRFPDQLSGGQRQRVAVARAVVHRPIVILADEPTGALDEANALGVVELLFGVQRDIGATMILVTHDPSVAAHAERIDRLGAPASRSRLAACR